MGDQKPMPTEARIVRFVRAMARANPDLGRIRLTAGGDLEAERSDGTVIEPASYDAVDVTRR